MEYEEIEGGKEGSTLLLCDGYLYKKEGRKRRRNGSLPLRCRRDKKNSCPGRAMWIAGEDGGFTGITVMADHDHGREEQQLEKLRLKRLLMLESERSTEDLRDVFDRQVNLVASKTVSFLHLG